MRISDWSSDVCSSDLAVNPNPGRQSPAPRPHVDRILGAGPFSFLQNLARCQTAGPVFAQLLVAVLGPRHERQLVPRQRRHRDHLAATAEDAAKTLMRAFTRSEESRVGNEGVRT